MRKSAVLFISEVSPHSSAFLNLVVEILADTPDITPNKEIALQNSSWYMLFTDWHL